MYICIYGWFDGKGTFIVHIRNALLGLTNFHIRSVEAHDRPDFEFPIIKTTKLLVETRS